jgi:hypothetical protein
VRIERLVVDEALAGPMFRQALTRELHRRLAAAGWTSRQADIVYASPAVTAAGAGPAAVGRAVARSVDVAVHAAVPPSGHGPTGARP